MHPEVYSSILVIEPSPIAGPVRIGTRLQQQLANAPRSLVVGPDSLRPYVDVDRHGFRSWERIRRCPDASETETLFRFNSSVVTACNAVAKNWGTFLSFGFMAPHSEDLPYLTAGIRGELQDLPPRCPVHFFEPTGSLHTIVALESARLMGFSIHQRWGLPTELLSYVRNSAKKLRVLADAIRNGISLAAIPLQPAKDDKKRNPPPTVLLFFLRRRLLAYWENVTPFLAPSLQPLLVSSEGDLSLFSYATPLSKLALLVKGLGITLLGWPKVSRQVRESSEMFSGVPVGRATIASVRSIWFSRGCLLPMIAACAERMHERDAPVLGASLEPTETSKVLEHSFRSRGKPWVTYMPIDDGIPLTRSLWSAHLRGTNVAAVNQSVATLLNGHMVGNTLFLSSDLSPNRDKLKSRIGAKLGISENRKWVLLLSRHISPDLTVQEKERLYRWARAGADILDGELIAKCHPHESAQRTRTEAKRWDSEPSACVGDNDIPLRDLCAAADLVVSLPSSSAPMEALAVGTPVVIVDWPEISHGLARPPEGVVMNNSFVESGACRAVSSAEEMAALARSLLKGAAPEKNPASISFWERFNGPADGQAPQRMANYLIQTWKKSL